MQQLSTTQCQVGFVNFLAFSPNAMTGSGGRRRPAAAAAARNLQSETRRSVVLAGVVGTCAWGARLGCKRRTIDPSKQLCWPDDGAVAVFNFFNCFFCFA